MGNGLLGNFLLNKLQDKSIMNAPVTWKRNNAIIVLGAGTVRDEATQLIQPTLFAYSRIEKGASEYFSCMKTQNKCTIIISGGDATYTGVSEAELYRHYLLDLNIVSADILVENQSLNTFKNAEFTDKILQKNTYDNIVLVTSGIHLKRSLLYFSYFKIYPIPRASDFIATYITPFPNGYNVAITEIATHEYLGIARFHIYNYFGLNKMFCYNLPIKHKKP